MSVYPKPPLSKEAAKPADPNAPLHELDNTLMSKKQPVVQQPVAQPLAPQPPAPQPPVQQPVAQTAPAAGKVNIDDLSHLFDDY